MYKVDSRFHRPTAIHARFPREKPRYARQIYKPRFARNNGSIYEQRDSGAMGSPVSTVIANLYMEIFEEQAIESAPCKPKIWKRYVDDTFTILDRDKVDDFLQHLNSQQPSIRFTM